MNKVPYSRIVHIPIQSQAEVDAFLQRLAECRSPQEAFMLATQTEALYKPLTGEMSEVEREN